jgi:hypothetical protein
LAGIADTLCCGKRLRRRRDRQLRCECGLVDDQLLKKWPDAGVTDQAHIIETGNESYRFRRSLEKKRGIKK